MAKAQTYIALLYSVVLGPGRRVIMSELKEMAAEAELCNPRTVLATGNLIFESDVADIASLETLLERAFEKRFGKSLNIIVRSATEWNKLVAANPYPEASRTDASHVIVRVNREPVTHETLALLNSYLANGEQLAAVGKDLWVHFAKDIGHSKLAAAITPKRAGIGTGRNWNTIQKIATALKVSAGK